MKPFLARTPSLPLAGKRVLITRAREQAASFSQLLESAGAEVVSVPLIQIVDPVSWTDVDQALDSLEFFHCIIFSSVNAADQWVKRGLQRERPFFARSNRIWAVGASTAARLRELGFIVDKTPNDFSARGILELLERDLHGKKILLPRGDLAREELPEELRSRGAEVVEAVVYRTQPATQHSPEWLERIGRREVDVIAFASPSSVHQFVQWVGVENVDRLRSCFSAASIGPTTSAALRESGFTVAMEASPSTLEALTAAIIRFYEPS